jgi:hypothetical protein
MRPTLANFFQKRLPWGKDAAASINHVFNLSYIIPAGSYNPRVEVSRSIQFRVSGRGVSDGESFTVSDVVFSTVPDTVDSDFDGVPDMTELVHGTNPQSATSALKIGALAATSTPGTLVLRPTRRCVIGCIKATPAAIW